MTVGQGLKVIMAVSADGYVSRGPADDMRWTGKKDKAIFKLLTMTGGELGVGRRTAAHMPPSLPGRTLHVLSHSGAVLDGVRAPPMRLGEFVAKYPGAWLIGGQTIVLEALELGLVDEVHLCRLPVDVFEFPGQKLALAQDDMITPFLEKSHGFMRVGKTRVDDVGVEHWR
jgi:dihydrofolate reductase